MGCDCSKKLNYGDPAQLKKEGYITLGSGGNRQIGLGNYIDEKPEIMVFGNLANFYAIDMYPVEGTRIAPKAPSRYDDVTVKENGYTTSETETNLAKIKFGDSLDSDTTTSSWLPYFEGENYTKPRIVDGGYTELRIVTRYSVGEGLIAYTVIGQPFIAVVGDIEGALFEEAELHEVTHRSHPDASEQSVRDIVRSQMPKAKG